jgi:hypothetical protein
MKEVVFNFFDFFRWYNSQFPIKTSICTKNFLFTMELVRRRSIELRIKSILTYSDQLDIMSSCSSLTIQISRPRSRKCWRSTLITFQKISKRTSNRCLNTLSLRIGLSIQCQSPFINQRLPSTSCSNTSRIHQEKYSMLQRKLLQWKIRSRNSSSKLEFLEIV